MGVAGVAMEVAETAAAVRETLTAEVAWEVAGQEVVDRVAVVADLGTGTAKVGVTELRVGWVAMAGQVDVKAGRWA